MPADSPFFRGHFRDFPLLPGVVQVNELALREARRRWPDLRVLERVLGLKFRSPIRPNDRVAIHLDRKQSRPRQLRAAARRQAGRAPGFWCSGHDGILPPLCRHPDLRQPADDRGRRGRSAAAPRRRDRGRRRQRGARARRGRRHRGAGRRPHRAARSQRRQGRRGEDRSGVRARARVLARAADRRRRSARHRTTSRRFLELAARASPGGGARATRSSTARHLGAARRPRAHELLDVHRDRRPRVIVDPQCGFRVYPVARRCEVATRSDRMAFDIEIAVRLVWAGMPIVNLPTARALPLRARVAAFPTSGRSEITWPSACMHTRLVLGSLFWRLTRGARRRR